MHPQERDLIVGVFDRVATVANTAKDPEAEALIRERARALPDPLYALTQAVCLQEVALRQAQTRIAELERQLAAPRPAAGGSFLGTAPANPWGAAPPTSVPTSLPPQPMQPAPQYQPQYPQQQQAAPWGMGAMGAMPSGGGGFLRGVAGTAMGVAGGTLLAEGISSLFSGHHGGFGGGLAGLGGSTLGSGALAGEAGRVVENVTVNNYYGDQGGQDTGDTSADLSADDAGWDNGGADDGGSADF